MKIQAKSKEPFYYQGGKTGCLLVHGFTSSPAEMAYLGQQLAAWGYTVNGVLLAGHGQTPQALKETQWQDWYQSVVGGYERLQESCDQVYLIGSSMGGALSLYGSCHLPVAGVVSICAPIYLVDKKAAWAPYVHLFKPYYLKNPDVKEETTYDRYGRFNYNLVPMKALVNLLRLIKQVKRCLPTMTAPALIMQSTKDRVVEPESGQYIFDSLGSAKKELVWLEKSGHLAAIEVEREQVAKKVKEFIEGLAK